MKAKLVIGCVGLLIGSVQAATTIDPASPYAYAANIGWINAEADTANGAVIGQAFCSGTMYSANCGWIALGDGTPVNGIAYQNSSAIDFGVNHDGLGNLTGYAYGANIGWITFEQTYGQPQVDLVTGDLSGYAYGANVGWIRLDGLKTLSLAAPDSDADGMADAWELGHTNLLAGLTDGGADADGDGVSDLDEYGADTDPTDPADLLRITEFQVAGTANEVTWPAKPTRLYTLLHAAAMSNTTVWAETVPPFIPAGEADTTETVTGVSDDQRFYRVTAEPPLSP